MLNNPIARLRVVGIFEGISFILLLFIAVPIKHIPALGGHHGPVEVLGPIHGGLFLIYLVAALLAARRPGLPKKLFLLTVAASIVPFGPFLIDPHLRRREADLSQLPAQAEC